MSYVQRVFYVGKASEPVDISGMTAHWVAFEGATGTGPEFPLAATMAGVGSIVIVGLYSDSGQLFVEDEPLEATGMARILVASSAAVPLGTISFSAGDGTVASFSESIIAGAPQWYWRLDEATGVVAVDEMGNGDLTYESDASVAGYDITASSTYIDGSAKDINADSARQIFDVASGGAPSNVQDPQDYVARWELENIATGSSASTTPTDYIARWSCDDDRFTAGLLYDSSSNSFNLDVQNFPDQNAVAGAQKQAVRFLAASSTYCDRTRNAAFEVSDISLSFWVKQNSAATGYVWQYGQSYSGDTNHSGHEIYITSTYNVGLNVYTGSGQSNGGTATSDAPLTDGLFHHVVVTYDGTTANIYIDGVLNTSTTLSVALGYDITNTKHIIGCESYAGSLHRYYLDADIDELLFYDRILSLTEVAELYATKGIIAEWKLDSDGTDTYGNHGASAVNSPTYGTGFVDNACVLNGTDQYYTITNHADLRPTNMTACAWVKTSSTTGMIFHVGSRNTDHAGFYLYLDAAGGLTTEIASNTGAVLGTDRSTLSGGAKQYKVGDGKWHHVAMTYDGTTHNLYIDGVLVITESYANGLAYDTTTYARIGVFTAAGGQQFYFNGRIDGVKLFNYAATADQVAALSRIAVSSTYAEHSGLIHGSPISTVDNGQIGQAITFNGIDDYIEIPNSAALRPTEVSVSAWVETTASGGDPDYIFQSYNDNASDKAGFRFQIGVSGQVVLVVGSNTGNVQGTGYEVSSSGAVNDGEWHHVVGTYDGVNLKTYIDGALVDTTAFAGGIAYQATNFIEIGRHQNDFYTGSYFNGTLDDARVYDRAITQTEITAMFNSRVAAPPVDFVAEWLMEGGDGGSGLDAPTDYWGYWKLEEASGSLTDEVGANDHPLNQNNATRGIASSGVDGGYCYTFDGVNEKIGRPSASSMNFATATYSWWFKTSGLSANGEMVSMYDGGNRGYRIVQTTSGAISFAGGNAAGTIEYVFGSGTDWDDGEWHHAAFSYTANQMTLWLDGVRQGRNNATHVIDVSADSLSIGDRRLTSTEAPWEGSMDEFKCYTRVLSNEEVMALYLLHTDVLVETTGDHDGRTIAFPTFTTGWENNALTLNGSTQYATVVDDAALRPANVSVSAWVKTTDTSNSEIFCNWEDVDGVLALSGYLLEMKAAGTIHFATSANTGRVLNTDWAVADSTSTVNDGDWHHVVATTDGSNMKVYIDGTLEPTTSVSFTLGYRGTEDTLIGLKRTTQSGDLNHFNGSIDSLKVYDRAITEAEVQALANYMPPTGVYTVGDISVSQDFTIECAFKIDTATASMMLMGIMDDTINWGIRLTSGDANVLELVLVEADTTDRTTTICSSLSAAGVAADGVWHWLSIRMDRATNELLSTVIDGTEVTSIDVSTWGTSWLFSDSSQFTIGDTVEAGSNAWNGGVDEVAIYQTAIAASQRTTNYTWWSSTVATGILATKLFQDEFELPAPVTSYRGDSQFRSNFRTSDVNYTGIIGDYAVGVPAPVVAPTIAISDEVAADDIDADTRFYLMTYVNKNGYESAPGPVTARGYHVGPATTVQLTRPLFSDVGNHPAVYGKNIPQDYTPVVEARIYRTNTGTTETGYQFVATVGLDIKTSLFGDVENQDLGELLVTDGWDVPPPIVTAGCKMANGTYLLVHEYTVYMSIPGVIYAFPVLYNQVVKDKLLHIEAVGTAAVALSDGGPYLIAGGSPDVMEVVKLPFYQGCQSVRAVSVYLDLVIYPAQDGLMGVTAAGKVVNLTEGVYEEQPWREAYDLTDLISEVYDGTYYAWEKATGNGFAFHIESRSFQPLDTDIWGASGMTRAAGLSYSGSSDSFYMSDTAGGILYEWEPSSGVTPVEWHWHSKEFYIPDRSYGACKLTGVLDSTNTVNVTLNVDGADLPAFPIDPLAVQADGVCDGEYTFRLPAVRGSKFILELSTAAGAPEVHTVQIAVHPSEII